MKLILISQIFGNPNQPRKIFDADELAGLAASIRENGLLQPITVRKEAEDYYMIVAGERRFRASQILAKQGGKAEIMCLVSTVADAQLAVDSIIENDQRVDVTLMEQARSYNRMIEEYDFTVETLAKKLGKREHVIRDRIMLLKLTPQCQQLLERGQLYQTQAMALAGLSEAGQSKLLRAINQGLCRNVTALNGIAAAIADAEAQTSMFGDALTAPVATVIDINAARGFEAKLEQIAAMLRAGIDANTVTAVQRVNPDRAATIAETLLQMQRDLHRMEAAFRISAVQTELAA